MASDVPKVVPLTCHGHSRPVPHISFSSTVEDDQYYLISACKDNNPMLRDGITGDWLVITLPPTSECCADPVIPGSVPFSDTKELYGRPDFRQMQAYQPLQPQTSPRCHSKVWDTHTGECLHTLQHSHICRAVAFPIQPNPQVLATGGAEKKLRIFDLTRTGGDSNNSSPTSPTGSNTVTSYEIGPGVHGGTIKSIIWNRDYNILTTAAEDRKIRWWDLRSRHPVIEYAVDGPIGSCELNSLAVRPNDPGILAVAAGKSVYLFDGITPGRILKKMDFRYDVASVAVNNETGRLVTGSANDTWARVYDLHTDEELEVQKGHHGPIWSVSFSPDGKLYGTGSEDGTIKLWKACRDPYGLWR